MSHGAQTSQLRASSSGAPPTSSRKACRLQVKGIQRRVLGKELRSTQCGCGFDPRAGHIQESIDGGARG